MKSIFLSVVLVSSAGCAAQDKAPGYGEGLGTPGNPIPKESSYSAVSRVDFTAEMPQIQAELGDVRAFSQNPAHTLLAIAQRTNEPALQQLYSGMPTTLRDQLEGWINVEVDKIKIGNTTMKQCAADLATIAETSLSKFSIESELWISPSKVIHSLNVLNFTPPALDILVPIGGLDGEQRTQYTTATVAEGGALTVSDHHFGLAFGQHVWQAINLASKTLYDSDLRTTLVQRLNCPAIAQAVSAKCVFNSCVGHATELQTVCEHSADGIVSALSAALPEFDMTKFRFVQGSARLVDDNQDGIAEAIADGTWKIEFDHGTELRSVDATFTAH